MTRAGRDLVLDLLREAPDLPSGTDEAWDACAARLVSEDLGGVGLSCLARSGRLAGLRPSARGTLDGALTAVRLEQAVLFHRFEQLAVRLRDAGVDFLVHKGAALAPLIYERPEDRPMVDVDIIFRPSDWQRVRDTLLAAGYRLPPGSREAFWLENYFNLSVMSPTDPPSHFDLHWSLTQEGRYHIDTEDLFFHAVSYRLGGVELLRLGNEDLLLSLFLHLTYHYFEARLLWLYDMKRILSRWTIDWDSLQSRAGQWGLKTVVAFNVAYLEKVFPGSVPADVIAQTRAPALRRALASPLMSPDSRHLFRSEDQRLMQFVIGLLAIDRPADAARFAADKTARTLRWLGRRPSRR